MKRLLSVVMVVGAVLAATMTGSAAADTSQPNVQIEYFANGTVDPRQYDPEAGGWVACFPEDCGTITVVETRKGPGLQLTTVPGETVVDAYVVYACTTDPALSVGLEWNGTAADALLVKPIKYKGTPGRCQSTLTYSIVRLHLEGAPVP